MRRPSRWLSGLASLLAAYLAFLLARYFFPPHLPRFRVETIFMWFVAVGVAAICARGATVDDSRPAQARRSYKDRDNADRALLPWHYLALLGAFLVAAVALYGGALRIGLLSDDFVLADLAARRQWIHDAQAGFMRPVVPVFWAALSFVPLRFDVTLHLANIVLHAVNALLVVLLAIRMEIRPSAAVAGGILFVTFPAVSEPIVWAAGVQDVLMTTLALVAIVSTLELGSLGSRGTSKVLGPRPGARTALLAAAVGASTLALGIKETAVATPALAWLIAYASPAGCRRGIQRMALLAMTAIAVAYAAIRLVGGLPPGYARISRYLAKQLLVEPLATLGAPWSASWMQVHPWAALGRSLLLVALVLAAVWFWRRTDAAFRAALAGATWVLVSVAPVASFFHVTAQLEGERYVYLPNAGFALLLAALLGDLAPRVLARLPLVPIGALVLALAMPSVPAVRSRMNVWVDASRLRDQILDSYVEIMSFARCSTVRSEGPVDGVNGAQVLRNGFLHAVAARGHEPPTGGDTFRCRVNWNGRIVVRQEE